VLRDPDPLLSLRAAVAVCDAIGDRIDGAAVRVKWPNDIVVGERLAKLAGILSEGRPQEGWAVLGIGINVAVQAEELPPELQATAASLGRPPGEIEPLLAELLQALELRLSEPPQTVLDAWRARDALYGCQIVWEAPDPAGTGMRRQSGRARGIDEHGQLLVRLPGGTTRRLGAGEVRLRACSRSSPPWRS
jgi:BirA family biotin operon repressor/biotin-[acetyl-CoA-carboxylase] ligase